MKTVNLNSVTLKKNGIPIDLMGVTDKKSKWEHIVSITTSEETAQIIIDKDKNGNQFALESAVIEFDVPIGATNSSYISIRSKNREGALSYLGEILNGVLSGNRKCSSFIGIKINDGILCASARGINNTSTMTDVDSFAQPIRLDMDTISYLDLRVSYSANFNFPIGTKIVLRGVRA